MKSTNIGNVKIEDIFKQENETLHDKEELKRLLLEGSKIGKNIIKKQQQLDDAKKILSDIDFNSSVGEIKNKLITMHKIYEKGSRLDKQVGYVNMTKNKDKLVGMCYNLVAGKMETLERLKDAFESEVEGY